MWLGVRFCDSLASGFDTIAPEVEVIAHVVKPELPSPLDAKSSSCCRSPGQRFLPLTEISGSGF
jgi:hypothetical protein